MLKDPERTKNEIVRWIMEYFQANAPAASAVVGISGGKDSSVTAALCVAALGTDRVVGVTMPDGIQPDIEDSNTLLHFLRIPSIEINIQEITAAFKHTLESNLRVGAMSSQANINMPPRIRMAVLYAVAQSLPTGGLVANTCNRSEDYVGYSTKFGDAAGDFSPLANLTVREVLQLGDVLSLPEQLLRKAPSDGLSGMTDEEKLGFAYADLDAYIESGFCADPILKSKIDTMHKRNLHKLLPMPSYRRRKLD